MHSRQSASHTRMKGCWRCASNARLVGFTLTHDPTNDPIEPPLRNASGYTDTSTLVPAGWLDWVGLCLHKDNMHDSRSVPLQHAPEQRPHPNP